MTPNDIDVLLHYHVSPILHPSFNAPAVQEATHQFLLDGILESTGDSYTTSDRGKAWIEMILRVPYPRQVWVDEKGIEVI